MVGMNMPTSEQRHRFEQLCLLRSLYARRGESDATGIMSLAELADHVLALFDDSQLRDVRSAHRMD